MAENESEPEPRPTQQTKPAEGEPIEIPVPKRDEIEDLLSQAAKPIPAGDDPAPPHGDPLDR
jgi:hypothetical protein